MGQQSSSRALISQADFRAEGPAVRPAQGNALGDRENQISFSGPTGQPFVGRTVGPLGRRGAARELYAPQGVALGWANRGPVGAAGTRPDAISPSRAVPTQHPAYHTADHTGTPQ